MSKFLTTTLGPAMVDPEVQRAAAGFWRSAGFEESFPRNLEKPLAWALPLAVVKLPRLWVSDIQEWVCKLRIQLKIPGADRSLRGCLIAHRGRGVAFLDGSDDECERRLSLAHEIGHFMLDYYLPRQRAIELLGPEIASVLDGERRATTEERLTAILTSIPVGVHCELFVRKDDGAYANKRTVISEARADALALELLAPANRVLHFADRRSVASIRSTLIHDFGLPMRISESYATFLRDNFGASSFREWLGL